MTADLTSRQKTLLKGIVQRYIQTANPVGSDDLISLCRLDCSPATVRNEMAALEEMDYLHQPHPSAGRVPTDKGYRFYVDGPMKKIPVTVEEEEGIQDIMRRARGNAAMVFAESSLILGKISQELGIVLTPQLSLAVFDRLELIGLSERKMLVVIHVQSRLVRTVVLQLDADWKDRDLETTTVILNERLSGLTLDEIRRHIHSRLGNRLTETQGLLRFFVEKAPELFDYTGQIEAHTSGTQHIVSQPEFVNRSLLGKLFAFIEDKSSLATMARTIGEHPTVTIGRENQDDRLRPFSVVASNYRMGNDMGVVGILGPTRMPYHKVIPLVKRMAEAISDFLS